MGRAGSGIAHMSGHATARFPVRKVLQGPRNARQTNQGGFLARPAVTYQAVLGMTTDRGTGTTRAYWRNRIDEMVSFQEGPGLPPPEKSRLVTVSATRQDPRKSEF